MCALWIVEATILGIIATMLVLFIIDTRPIDSDGHNSDLWMCSITLFSIVIILNTIKIAMHVQYWTKLFVFAIVVCSLAPYLIYVWISNYALSQYVERTTIMCFRTYLTYFVVIFVTCLALLIISIIIYIMFHSNEMLKKIRFKMEDLRLNCEETLSMESFKGEEQILLRKLSETSKQVT